VSRGARWQNSSIDVYGIDPLPLKKRNNLIFTTGLNSPPASIIAEGARRVMVLLPIFAALA
jgi:hypothetical protein